MCDVGWCVIDVVFRCAARAASTRHSVATGPATCRPRPGSLSPRPSFSPTCKRRCLPETLGVSSLSVWVCLVAGACAFVGLPHVPGSGTLFDKPGNPSWPVTILPCVPFPNRGPNLWVRVADQVLRRGSAGGGGAPSDPTPQRSPPVSQAPRYHRARVRERSSHAARKSAAPIRGANSASGLRRRLFSSPFHLVLFHCSLSPTLSVPSLSLCPSFSLSLSSPFVNSRHGRGGLSGGRPPGPRRRQRRCQRQARRKRDRREAPHRHPLRRHREKGVKTCFKVSFN